MRAITTSVALALALAAASAQPARAADSPVSGSMGVTSDYLFRGASQTQGGPALQAGLRYDHASGAYVTGWTSNVDYGPGYEGVDREVDLVLGFAREVGPVSIDLSRTRYVYPGAEPDGSLDYAEWLLTAGFGPRWSATAGFTDDFSGTGTRASYLQLAYTHPLGAAFELRAAVGEARFESALADYRHAELGAGWSRGPWSARLTLHATSGAARDNFGDQAARGRLEAALGYAF